MGLIKDNLLRPWEVIRRNRLMNIPPWLQVWQEEIRLPDGRIVGEFYSIDQPDYVVVFPTNSAQQVLCLWHYKHGPRRVCLGLPAGYIQNGETPLASAKRELWEETGCKAKIWQELGSFTADGNRGCGQGYIFRAQNIYKDCEPMSNDLEEFKIEWLNLATLKKHLFSGDVVNMSDALGMCLGLNAFNFISEESSNEI